MGEILNMLQSIGNAIGSLISFIAGIIADLIQMVAMSATIIASAPVWLSWLFPTSVVASVMLILSIVVLKLIIGRE